MKGYYRQVADLLTQAGYWYLRQGKGSHEIWTNGQHTQTVPFNCESRHTANAILKSCGIKAKL